MKRLILGWIPFFAMTVLFMGTAGAVAAQGRVLRVVAPWKAKGLEPEKAGFIYVRMGCMEALTTVDRHGRIVGQLAESWSVAEDKLTWTFILRKGVKFHDGSLLTPEAVAVNLNRSIEKKGVLSRTPVTRVKPVGKDQVRIVTKQPFAPLPAYLAHYSCGILSPKSFDLKGQVVDIIGTGQFLLFASEGGKVFRFKAFPDYWGEKPRIAETSYTAVPKGETRGFMVEADQAEMGFTLSPMAADKIRASGKADIVAMTIPRTRQLMINCSSPFFSDVRVRRAMSLAINRPAIAKNILRHPDSAATQLLAPVIGLWHEPGLAQLEYDPVKARALLAEAGWNPGPQGILLKDGIPFKITLDTYSARPMLPPVATALHAQLRQVGIDISIAIGESSNIPAKRKDGALQMALLARNYGLIPDPIGNIAADFGPKPGHWGSMGWQSMKMNDLIEQYWEAFDQTEAKRIRKGILTILQEELPVIPVSWYEHIVSVSKKVGGIHIDPFELRSYVAGAYWVE
ncbi:MAG: ABC transporter substrate-binding protein [Deltaproteobacteria bacterium]|nr:ABC transporter substrate-binding protein [Deltaproteobacteria bacterium]